MGSGLESDSVAMMSISPSLLGKDLFIFEGSGCVFGRCRIVVFLLS
jgi:hypothetical protein